MRTVTIVSSMAMATVLTGCVGVKPGVRARGESRGPRLELKYGFRYDPMKFVENDDSVGAALVRWEMGIQPKPEDAEQIAKHVGDSLAQASEIVKNGGGGLHAGHTWKFRIACEQGWPEAGQLVEEILKTAAAGDKDLDVYRLQFVGLAGRTNDPLARRSAKRLAAQVMAENPWVGCQWGPFLKLRALFPFADVAGAAAAIDRLMSAIEKDINAAGYTAKGKTPWGQVQLLTFSDHLAARRILRKTIPFILTAQRPDGGWKHHTLAVVRSLKKAGLFEALRQAPPKPDDWRIARTIPAPQEGNLRQLQWDGEKLWVLRHEPPRDRFAVALSPKDGSILKTIKLPGSLVMSIGWWDGKLRASQKKPRRLLMTIDPDTGELESSFSLAEIVDYGPIALVNGKVWIGDDHNFCMAELNADGSGKARFFRHPTGKSPRSLTVGEGGMWHAEWGAPVLILTGLDGALLDFATCPLPETSAIAWAGDQLWVLDTGSRRICQIERTEEGQAFAQHFIRGDE